MSDTPRTDAVASKVWAFDPFTRRTHDDLVLAEFAQELERENISLIKENELAVKLTLKAETQNEALREVAKAAHLAVRLEPELNGCLALAKALAALKEKGIEL